MNADEDIREGGVQAILLVEDSIRFYSTYLPEIYKLLLLQNTEFLKDAFNEQQQVLRKRARRKSCWRVATRRPWNCTSVTRKTCWA